MFFTRKKRTGQKRCQGKDEHDFAGYHEDGEKRKKIRETKKPDFTVPSLQ
jgi:hypothetical protein